MDELDVRIFRALMNDRLSAPFSTHIKASLRQVARDLRVDDVTVRNRFKRFRERGFLSGWRLLPNPNLFGYRYTVLLVDLPPGSQKEEMIARIKLLRGVVVILDYHRDSLGINMFNESDQSVSLAIESITKITNAERITQYPVVFPPVQKTRLTEMDWAIIRNMGGDAWKSHVKVAKELGITARTVKNRLQRLELQNALVIPPALDISSLDRTVGFVLFYSYISSDVKNKVDRALLSYFNGSYLWARTTNPERAYLILIAPTTAAVKQYLEWTKRLPGIDSARAEIVVESINLWDKETELFEQGSRAL